MKTQSTKHRNYRRRTFLLLFYFLLAMLLHQHAWAQVNSNITISPQVTPVLTPCSGQGTFVVRVSNIGASGISNLIFRDSMPPGINYVAGSVSGTGVTFGSTIIVGNVVTFNIANVPTSSFVDITFKVAASCSVSTNSTTIKNTYQINWSTFFTNPYVTPTYIMQFPSLSVTVDSPSVTRLCGVPFVRKITICNGGFGPVDSVTLSDVEGNASLSVVGFSNGIVSGANTNNAKTVIKAADFATVGNLDGRLDQGECIVITDTLKGISTASPVTGTITANWGCSAGNCTNGTTSNVFSVNTVISPSAQVAALTRTSFVQTSTDSSGQIFNRVTTYQEVIKNNSPVTGVNATATYLAMGLKYILTGTIMVSKNGGAPYAPATTNLAANPAPYGNPNSCMGNILAPASYTGSTSPNCVRVTLGDLAPGDSVVVTFSASTTGAVTRVSDASSSNNNGNFYFTNCSNYFRWQDGPSIGSVVDAYLTWSGQGCSPGNYVACRSASTGGLIYNGLTNVTEPATDAPVFLARFRSFSATDSTFIANGSPDCWTYNSLDTVRFLMNAGAMDLPFYTNRSKFLIKIYTKGGIIWDGNLAKVYGRLNSSSTANWYASQVVDNSAVDSTMTIYFQKSNCPVSNFGANNTYSGGFQLNMQLINTCPGPILKQLAMTRVYTIDTTSADPAIEAGPASGNYPFSWSSRCSSACSDGLQILNYSNSRINFGQPDNNNDGIADASGTINLSVVKSKLITWGDTLQLKYKMVVRTTQAGGVPYMYLKSTVDTAGHNIADVTTCNNFLTKTVPQIVLTRPGTGSFTATGVSIPVSTANNYLLNLSLQGTGGITMPGITSYQDGDTLEVTQQLVYRIPHQGWGLTNWNLIHTPYFSTVPNPTTSQQFKCDSITCAKFQTIDFNLSFVNSRVSANACGDSLVLRSSLYTQTASAACGNTFFPGEARSIVTPVTFNIIIPAASWIITSVKANYSPKINGTGSCTNVVNNQLLPASLYSISGDTLKLDLMQIGQFYGQNIMVNELRSYFYFDIGLKYIVPVSQQGCARDHTSLGTNFNTYSRFRAVPSIDSTTLVNVASTTVSFDINGNSINTVVLNWPGVNNNTIAFPASSVVTVTQPNVVIPITYTKGSSNIYGNDFMAIPNRAGIFVDSVKDNVTGTKIIPVGSIYNVAYMAANTSRNFSVYTHISLCQNDTLFMYADRLPCSGVPANWAAYACQAKAYKIGFAYITSGGELQMQDTLYSTNKDMCAADTVQFNVFNSQTQTAYSVKINFTLPYAMNLLPGQTQLRRGNGSFVTVADPVLQAGTYSWTLPATDSLVNVGFAPNNALSLRCGINTQCGYVSGSQIISSINGNVACGPITSLLNADPQPLKINGAPSLSYLTNVKGVATQITDCNNVATSPGYTYGISMHVSGGVTGATDKVVVTLPKGYKYVSYNATAPGFSHAPTNAPTTTVAVDSTVQVSWILPSGVPGGDSILFSFQYNEASTAVNKCSVSPQQSSHVNTYINSTVFCAAINANCEVSISSGADTVVLQSLKPSINNIVGTAVFSDASGNMSSAKSYLNMSGTLSNIGSAALVPGTNIIMEPFMDLDNSGTVTPGDYALDPFVYSGGLAINGTYAYAYVDSFNSNTCMACGNKNVLMRFSNNPSAPVGASQCLCDSVMSLQITPNNIPLNLNFGTFEGILQGCNQAMLTWSTYSEYGLNPHFDIEASTNGRDYTVMSTVIAKGTYGSSYKQIAAMPASMSYFRIVMWLNGNRYYSKVVVVISNCWTGREIAVYPNPFNNTVNVKGAAKDSKINLLDITGRKLLKVWNAGGNETDVLDFQGLAAGTYMLTITDVSGKVTRIKLSKE